MENMRAYIGDGKFAFISYVLDDDKYVYPVIRRLMNDGFNIWYDGGLQLIKEYPAVIIDKINKCSLFVIFASQRSIGSHHVNAEVVNAGASRKPILCINIDDCKLPDEWKYYISPTTAAVSLNAPESEYIAKLEAALSECRNADFNAAAAEPGQTVEEQPVEELSSTEEAVEPEQPVEEQPVEELIVAETADEQAQSDEVLSVAEPELTDEEFSVALAAASEPEDDEGTGIAAAEPQHTAAQEQTGEKIAAAATPAVEQKPAVESKKPNGFPKKTVTAIAGVVLLAVLLTFATMGIMKLVKNKEADRSEQVSVTFDNGDRYEGEYRNGKRNGQGVYYFAGGGCYEGEFSDNMYNGHGILYTDTGDRYEGEFIDNKLNGQGVFHSAKGDHYEGEFTDNMLTGHGTLYAATGDRYEGEWTDNEPNGQGTYYWKNGDRYEGGFKTGLLDGKGTYYYADGSSYEGEYKDNRKNGQGKISYADGSRYEGEWKDDAKNGKGVYYYANGDRYEGEFRNDLFDGQGVCYFANGDRCEGEWKDNVMNGEATYYHSDGRTETLFYIEEQKN